MNVVWYKANRGNWDCGLLLNVFEKHPDKFTQHNTVESPSFDRAIVIITGRPDVVPLRKYLETIGSGVVVLTSEEDAYFDWKAAIPQHLEIWTQYYSPSKEGIKTRLLLGAPNRLKDYKINLDLPKKYLWSFVGQVQNPSRQACVEVLNGLPDGFLHIADGFGGLNGLNYQDYLDVCCESKFVICPAGSMCVDSFRLYEAMECGAIPITEARAPRDKSSFNYWDEVYPENRLSLVSSWDDFKNYNLNSTPIPADVQNEWWLIYKRDLEQKLLTYAAN